MGKRSYSLIPLGFLFLILEIRTEVNNSLIKYSLLALAAGFFIAGFVAILKRSKEKF
ncbi:hypothetical protein [Elizabethkingia miricola]|uniref:Uncharacterized protein n=1 Tax=Elizabethkingia miricola TaxID=172045 RepID=A0ABD5B6Z2_ELIMR|nr:hypothetical protein [Elizabethkingia miricola]MDQ8749687.1 hypothetical protein [Elizabethkingia miricola]